MTQQFLQKLTSTDEQIDLRRLFGILSKLFTFIVCLTVFQDFLESKRSGYSFYFSESILFKTIWFLFIPILGMLYQVLKNKKLDKLHKTAFFIAAPIVIHFIILLFVVLGFSVLFYNGRYDLYKMFTYTFANDFYKLVLIYSVFVLGYKHLSGSSTTSNTSDEKVPLENIVIGHGKDHTIVKTKDILKITSTTPYITIHLENKKYLHQETLKSVCGLLDDKAFIRVHKSTVVNICTVVSFKSRLNGDYDLLLVNGDQIRLSRTYATHFKKLFKANHQLTT